jgi:hypothetical protein
LTRFFCRLLCRCGWYCFGIMIPKEWTWFWLQSSAPMVKFIQDRTDQQVETCKKSDVSYNMELYRIQDWALQCMDCYAGCAKRSLRLQCGPRIADLARQPSTRPTSRRSSSLSIGQDFISGKWLSQMPCVRSSPYIAALSGVYRGTEYRYIIL